MKLSELKNSESAVIVRVSGHGGFRKRIMEMGFVRGQKVTSVINAPMNDPIKYKIMGYDVSLRRSEADLIEVLSEAEADAKLSTEDAKAPYYFACENCECGKTSCFTNLHKTTQRNIINIAFVGNPNSGKTSLFNALSGGNEHVGNYSGVTVDIKTGHFNYCGYHFNVTDLPGTYSLSAYTPEEVYVRRYLQKSMPDVIINAVVASNLERNLYLTTELIDLNQRVVVALNMYDEFVASGATLDYEKLGSLMGIPMVPTVAKNGQGLNKLLDCVIEIFEGRNAIARHVHINHGSVIEPEITALSKTMREANDLPQQFPARYWAIKTIENDSEAIKTLENCADFSKWQETAKASAELIQKHLNKDVEMSISDEKYGFISGALHETFVVGSKDIFSKTRKIDTLVANKWLGFPLFIFIMWLMFFVTFKIGAFPQDWIDTGFTALSNWLNNLLPNNAFRSLLVDGMLAGIGAVCSFVPNILLLFLFISLMEDSGYMSRAAFIMDNIMHKMGLHGKSFIPMLMGFGCNAPAIMSTRTIESRSSRLITMLVIPFMSCSARLPIYVLLAGTFFPTHAASVMIALYVLGVLVAAVTAKILRITKFGEDETPFVMELPPYRMPTVLAVFKHMWDKCVEYLKKIGTVILGATIVVWLLTYFPRPMVETTNANGEIVMTKTTAEKTDCEHSYLGNFGKLIEPVMEPIGLNWRTSIAAVASLPAKEITVSTLGVLYGGEDEATLSEAMASDPTFSPASAIAMMVFMLLCFPCLATLSAIYGESGKLKWVFFTIIYNTAVAWVLSFITFRVFGVIL